MSRCEGCGGEDCICCEVFQEQKYDMEHQFEDGEDVDDLWAREFDREVYDDEEE